MDLLRQVLARLSLQRLIYLRLVENEALVRVRLGVVNDLTSEEFRSTKIRYAKLCELQGELSYQSAIWAGNLLSRAAFLNQLRWFDTLGNIISDLEVVLNYGGPEIRESACKTVDSSSIQIVDPSSIPWTPSMRKSLKSKLRAGAYNANFLWGYLHYPDSLKGVKGDSVLEVCEGYAKAAIDGGEDPFVTNQSIDDALPAIGAEFIVIRSRLNRMGYFALNDSDPKLAVGYVVAFGLHYIQPGLLLPHLKNPIFLDYIQNYPLHNGLGSFTKDLVKRAEVMMALPIIFHPTYHLMLKIVTGRRLSETDLSLVAKDSILPKCMIDVSHPQLTKQIFEKVGRTTVHGTITYDPVNHLKVATDTIRRYGLTETYEKSFLFNELVARGQLWRCWDTPITDHFRII